MKKNMHAMWVPKFSGRILHPLLRLRSPWVLWCLVVTGWWVLVECLGSSRLLPVPIFLFPYAYSAALDIALEV